MKKNRVIIFSFIAALLVFALLHFYAPIDKQTIPVRFYLAERPGFEIEPGQLTFGAIPANQSASRGVHVQNEFDNPIKIEVTASREIANNIIVSENDFVLQPQEAKNISFTAFTYGLIEHRAYEGSVTITTHKA